MEEQGPAPDMQNPYEQAGSDDGANIPLAVVGAAAGGGAGGVVWFLIEHFASYQIGFVAILCGAAAGWGAVILGKGHGFQVGVIAAVFGLLGVIGGSYGSFAAAKSQAVEDMREQANQAIAQGGDEQEIRILEKGSLAEIDEVGYVDYLELDTKNAAWMAIFGIIGLAYGFSIGNGGLNKNDDTDYDA